MNRTKRILMVWLSCLLSSISMQAGHEVYSTIARTNNAAGSTLLNSSTSLLVRDAQYAKYLTNPTWANGFFDRNVKARIIFSIDHANLNTTGTTGTLPNYSINFTLTYKKNLTGSVFVSTQVTKTLNLNWASNKDKVVYEIPDGFVYEMDIKVNSMSAANASHRLSLEAEIDVERYYTFDPNQSFTGLVSHCSNTLATNGELEIFWQPQAGAEEYDLEWTYINNYKSNTNGTGVDLDPSEIQIDEFFFKNNSTRITTTNLYYRIPYLYEKGYILYRVRASGRCAANFYLFNTPAKWSYAIPSFSTVAQFPTKFPNTNLQGGCNTAEVFVAHESLLNWQASMVYAEEGKSKAAISYFDGSLHNRQSVTKVKTNEDVVVGETIYDHEGRPAINVLPVPATVNPNKIEYKKSFNLLENTIIPYSKEHFDVDNGGACAIETPGMNPSSGASNYYSPLNPQKNVNENQLIPDAKKIPFSQVEYTPDNTGRVRRQSGVGSDHSLGSQHETKYYYGTPFQKDLDRLFGSEVGVAEHYKKNMVIDANGQASVSYIDPSGKTIATSLAGASPANLIPLESNLATSDTIDLLNKVAATDLHGKNNKVNFEKGQIVMDDNILVPAKGPFDFEYELHPARFDTSCAQSHVQAIHHPDGTYTTTTVTANDQICYSCVYDLKISLKNECGEEVFKSIYNTGTPAVNTAEIGTLDYTCNSNLNNFSTNWVPEITGSTTPNQLPAGNYALVKTLTLNQAALDKYTKNYLDSNNNNCILKFSDFLNTYLPDVDFSGCGVTCAQCLEKLGPYSNYSGTNCEICLSQEEYNELVEDCAELCKDKSPKCEVAEQSMMADMSPGGQYAQYAPGGGIAGGIIQQPQQGAFDPGIFVLSVLNENNALPRKSAIATDYASYNFNGTWLPNWRHPYNPNETGAKRYAYLDEDGNIALVEVKSDGNGNYIPKVSANYANSTYVSNVNGHLMVQPRYLDNAEDFYNAWQSPFCRSLIAYHPEYALYQKCLEDSPSNDFDAIMAENETLAHVTAAISATYPGIGTFNPMYPLGKSGTNYAVIDPYFKAGGNGAAELANIQNYLSNYKSINGTTYSIWDFVYIAKHCPLATNTTTSAACALCSMPPGYVFTDEDWAFFSPLYYSVKQSFQDRINIQYSITQASSYNACIGSSSFNPFDNGFYTYSPPNPPVLPSIWNLWGWGTSQIWPANNPAQFFNIEQPCNWYSFANYSDKQPRFGTAKQLLSMGAPQNNTDCYDEDGVKIDCPVSDADYLEQKKNEAELKNYLTCGQCPQALNLQNLLQGLSTRNTNGSQQDLTSSTAIPLTCTYPEFSGDLQSQLGFATTDLVNWKKVNNSNQAILEGNIFVSGANTHQLYLKFPATLTDVPNASNPNPASFNNIYDYSEIIDVCCLQFDASTSTLGNYANGNFTCVVTVKTKTGDPAWEVNHVPTRKITLNGNITSMNLKDCEFEPVCQPTVIAQKLQNLLNGLLKTASAGAGNASDFFSTTQVVLNNQPYAALLNGELETQLAQNLLLTGSNGVSLANINWKWVANSMAAKTITATLSANTEAYTITLALPVNSSFNMSQVVKLSGIAPDVNNPGGFTAYALCRNGGNAAYQKITGTCTVSSPKLPINFGSCQNANAQNGLAMGNGVEHPQTLGLLCKYDGEMFAYLKNIVKNNLPLSSATVYNGVYSSGGSNSCSYQINLPLGSVYKFSDLQTGGNYILDIYPDPAYHVNNGNSPHFVVKCRLQNGGTVNLYGYFPCTTLPVICPPTSVADFCVSSKELITDGSFSLSSADHHSDYTRVNCTAIDGSCPLFEQATIGNYSNNHTCSAAGTVCPGNIFAIGAFGQLDINKNVWSQTVTIRPNTKYNFSFFAGINSESIFQVGFDVYLKKNNSLTKLNTSPLIQNLSFRQLWNKYEVVNWYSGSYVTAPTQVEIVIRFNTNPQVSLGGNTIVFDDFSLLECQSPPPFLTSICNPVEDEPEVDTPDDCMEIMMYTTLGNAQTAYNEYMAQLRKSFQEAYKRHCLKVYERFDMHGPFSEHHYTLYYYDQAGNLVRTVPPEGVRRIMSKTLLDQIKDDRENGLRNIFTKHTFTTTYKYNSLNQLVAQTTPDTKDLDVWKSTGLTGIDPQHEVQGMAFNGNNGIAVASGNNGGAIYLFNSQTQSWTLAPSLSANQLNDVLYLTSSNVIAVGNAGTIVYSTDGGNNWQLIPFAAATANLLAIDPASNNTGIIIYDTDGKKWQLNNSLQATASAQSQWVPVSSGESLLDMSFTTSGTDKIALALVSGNKIYRSLNGAAWYDYNSNQIHAAPYSSVAVNISVNNFMAVTGDGKIIKNDNLGNWTEIPSDLKTEMKYLVYNEATASLYCGNPGVLYRSTTYGSTWTAVSNTPAGFSKPHSPTTGNFIYGITATNVYAYDGNSWSTVGAAFSTSPAAVAMLDNTSGIVGLTNGDLYFYSNSTWTKINFATNQLTNKVILSIQANDINHAYVLVKNNTTALNELYYYNGSGSQPQLNIISNLSTISAIKAKGTTKAYAVSGAGNYYDLENGGIINSGNTGANPVNLNETEVDANGNQVMFGPNGEIFFRSASGGNISDQSNNIRVPALKAIKAKGHDVYCFGEDGTGIFYYTSKSRWDKLATAMNTNFKDADFLGANGLVVVGDPHINTESNSIFINLLNGSFYPGSLANTAVLNKVIYNGTNVYTASSNEKVLQMANLNPITYSEISCSNCIGTKQLYGLASNGSNLIAVGEGGKIIKGTNSALSNVNQLKPASLNDVAWLDANKAVAVGNNGTILTYSTTSNSWSVLNSGTNEHLKAIAKLNASKLVAVGENGTVCTIEYNGSSYTTSILSLGSNNLNDIAFYNQNGIIVGANGSLYISNTSTTTWSLVTVTQTTEQLNAVYMVNNTVAIAVGKNGTVLSIKQFHATAADVVCKLLQYSPAGGSSQAWPQYLNNGSNVDLNDVYFKDHSTGYAVGNNGFLMKTINCGTSWFRDALPSGNPAPSGNINAIAGTGSNNINIGGASGTSIDITDMRNEFSAFFFYDRLGRLVASQNSKQYAQHPRTYSYTLYDALGRISEVGELVANTDINTIVQNGQVDIAAYQNWHAAPGVVKTQVTRTYYDEAVSTTIPGFYQYNLRKRVSYTTLDENPATPGYDHATYYSYDIHGNVRSLIQDNPEMEVSNRYKRVDYEYDLISGKVNKVSYQAGAPDAFYHKYLYDADNRITNVFTSPDGVIWDQDAKYFYYRHGPLARAELGDLKVQGLDYAYTIQGWIKGVNSNSLKTVNDPGEDARAITTNSLNSFTAADEAGYSLGYFGGDYQSIGTTSFLAAQNGSNLQNNTKNLYNGNISQMVTSISKLADLSVAVQQARTFQYDQLNRIKNSSTFIGMDAVNNTWVGAASTQAYAENFSYDANGNILSLTRKDDAGNLMDNLEYKYELAKEGFVKNSNKLRAVKENAGPTNTPDDIENQTYDAANHSNDNYEYDNSGNLIKDLSEGIANISWTPYGKIASITRVQGSTKSNLEFKYDASGNRVMKKVTTPGGEIAYSYYVRDAQGNVMAVYNKKEVANVQPLSLTEQHIYGSSRLGLKTRNLNMGGSINSGGILERELDKKMYELSNHLGNVLATVSDMTKALDQGTYSSSGQLISSGTDGKIDFFAATVKSASDYYAFGGPQVGRQINPTGYKYGFNGKEKVDEMSVDGGSLDFGERIYDSRIGRWTSVDKSFKLQPDQSPYKSFLNNPIYYLDPDGKTEYEVVTIINEKTGKTTTIAKVKSNDVFNAGTVNVSDGMGGSYDKTIWKDKIHQTTVVIDKDGKQTVTKTEIFGDERTTTTGPLKDMQVYANFKVNSEEFFEGKGENQKGGFYLAQSSPGASPTKTKSLTDAEQRDVSELIDVLGSLGGGKDGIIGETGLPNKIADKIYKVVGMLNKTSDISSEQEREEKIGNQACTYCLQSGDTVLKKDAGFRSNHGMEGWTPIKLDNKKKKEGSK